jgi:OmpR family response regulator RpaB
VSEAADKILVVDDEDAVRRILQTRLSMVGYEVATAADGERALAAFSEQAPDLIVLDIMMPNGDGYYVCRELRKQSDVPVIMLTALGDVADRINGLQIGADDYLTKPFSPKELEARIGSVLRRFRDREGSQLPSSGIIRVGRLCLDTNKRRLYIDSEQMRLTGKEYSLLELLVSRSGESISRAEILETVWGYPPQRQSDLRVVDVHVSRLRSKIENDPKQPELILTERGTGYMFQRIVNRSEFAGVSPPTTAERSQAGPRQPPRETDA